MLIIGNYDLAGTEKFVSHLLRDDEQTTYCGLKFSKLKGDWQFEESSEFGCMRCRSIYDGEASLRYMSATNKVLHADAATPCPHCGCSPCIGQFDSSDC